MVVNETSYTKRKPHIRTPFNTALAQTLPLRKPPEKVWKNNP